MRLKSSLPALVCTSSRAIGSMRPTLSANTCISFSACEMLSSEALRIPADINLSWNSSSP